MPLAGFEVAGVALVRISGENVFISPGGSVENDPLAHGGEIWEEVADGRDRFVEAADARQLYAVLKLFHQFLCAFARHQGDK